MNKNMNQLNIIKKCQAAVFCLYILAMSNMEIWPIGRPLILSTLALLYAFLSLSFYFAKQRVASALVFAHSLFFIMLSAISFSSQPFQLLLTNHRTLWIIILVLLSLSQFTIYRLVGDEDEKIFEKKVEESSKFESRMEKKPSIAWFSKASIVFSIIPIIIYDTKMTLLLYILLFAKCMIDCWVRILLVQLFISNKTLLTYLSRLIVVDIFVYILLFYVLAVARSPFLYAVMILFSNFSLPFLKKKEFELMRE